MAGCVAGPAAVAVIAAAITYKLICCMAVKIDGLKRCWNMLADCDCGCTDTWQILRVEPWGPTLFKMQVLGVTPNQMQIVDQIVQDRARALAA